MNPTYCEDRVADGTPGICAVVVTHDRRVLLMDCLAALAGQTVSLAGILVVDNASTDGTPEALNAAGWLDAAPPLPGSVAARGRLGPQTWLHDTRRGALRFHYRRLATNTGGAGGFACAIECAYALGYAGLWLMDDDAEPMPDALERLLAHWSVGGLAALAGAVVEDSGLALTHRGRFDFRFERVFPLPHRPLAASCYEEDRVEIDMASFVGLLVKREAVARAGVPRGELFLRHDDAEYCIRLRCVGRILLVPGSRILHKGASRFKGHRRTWLGLSSMRPCEGELAAVFYHLRNLAWLGRTYCRSDLRFAGALILSWLRAVASVLLFDRGERMRRLRLIGAAYLDGLRGVFDNDKPRRLLAEAPPSPPPSSRPGPLPVAPGRSAPAGVDQLADPGYSHGLGGGSGRRERPPASACGFPRGDRVVRRQGGHGEGRHG